jgi:hypothetical protein
VSKLQGSSPAWDWFVEASPGQGEKETTVSPEDKLACHYRFSPAHSGIYSIRVPVEFSGSYRLAANQLGAGGRRALVRIGLKTTISHRGARHTRQQIIFEKKVTKGSDAGPFKHVHVFTDDADLWAGITPEETLDSDTVITMRVVLLADAKWKGSRAALDFRKADGAGIKFGPCTVTLEVPKPRPGEQRPPVKLAVGSTSS